MAKNNDIEKWLLEISKSGKSFYRTYTWVKFRKKVMTLKKYRCEDCWNGGILKNEVRKYKRATTLHHDKKLKEFPNLALTESNMIALCSDCHKKRHPEVYQKQTNFYKERWD
ncbi:MAG: HNH endonuclease [Oscillospiraceae bacterium]